MREIQRERDIARKKTVADVFEHWMETKEDKAEVFDQLIKSCQKKRIAADDCVRLTLLYMTLSKDFESDKVTRTMHEACKRSTCPNPCQKSFFFGCGYKTSNVVIKLFKEWGKMLSIKQLVLMVTSGVLANAHQTFLECFDSINNANIFGTPALGLEDVIRNSGTDERLITALIGPIMEEIIHRGTIKPIINQALKKLGVNDPRSISTLLSAIIFAISHLQSFDESQIRTVAPDISVQDMQSFMIDIKTNSRKKFFATLTSGIIYCTMQEDYGMSAPIALHILNNSFSVLKQIIFMSIMKNQLSNEAF